MTKVKRMAKVYEIPLDEIDEFPNHPYKVKDDEEMIELMKSIKINGVLTPATVRKKAGGRYEMLSGHRRKRACELLGKEILRCEILEVDNDSAIIFMCDSNLHRTTILPSEKAFAYKMRLDAMKRQGKRADLTCDPVGHKLMGYKSRAILAREVNESQTQIRRYILRNTSTHFVTEEYEMIYIPLFQACILNFVEKMQEFHNIDMTEVVPQNFLTLAVSMKALDENIIRAKYPEEIANKMILTDKQLRPMIEENNQGFAIKIEHLHFITKDKNQATSFVHVDKNAEVGVKIIKELKDPNNTHKYTMKTALKEINRRLQSAGVKMEMNQYIFGLFTKVYGIKENEKYCYVHKQYAQPSYTYSMQAIELIVGEVLKDPNNIVENLKKVKK